MGRPAKHNETKRNSPEYRAWCAMKERCLSPNCKMYIRYGGRGITVYQEWQEDYLAFLAHIGRRPSSSHSLDRIRNNEGYRPGNVRWATDEVQARNRRSNRLIEYNGVTKPLAGWADQIGLTANALKLRLDCMKWSIADAITRPGLVRQAR